MKKKCIVSLVIAIWLSYSSEVKSIEEFFVMWVMVVTTYLSYKFLFRYFKKQIRASGGFFSWFISVTDTTRYDKQIFDHAWNACQHYLNLGGCNYSGSSNKREADQRVFNQTKAQNEAMYHQYYANKNAGTYDGYRSANRAREARNRANRY